MQQVYKPKSPKVPQALDQQIQPQQLIGKTSKLLK